MKLVVDANVIISAVIRSGATLELLYEDAFELFAPEFVRLEILAHLIEVAQKADLTLTDTRLILDKVLSRARIIPLGEYIRNAAASKRITPDPNDWPYFALALKLSCPIWSNDKRLKQQVEVRVISTAELVSER